MGSRSGIRTGTFHVWHQPLYLLEEIGSGIEMLIRLKNGYSECEDSAP